MTSSFRRATARPPWAVAVFACALAWSVPAMPAPAARVDTIQDFHHTAWTLKDGAPAGIWAMAQTRDGWLWLGTSTGLYRFDGVAFERRDLRAADSAASRSIGVLYARRNGDLWIGYSNGGAAVLDEGGHVSVFEGLPEGLPVDGFDEDGDNRLWLRTAKGLFVLDGEAWHAADADWGLPAGPGGDLASDGAGSLWVSTGQGMYLLRKGAHRFEPTRSNASPGASIGPTGDGRLWKDDDTGISLLGSPAMPPASTSRQMSLSRQSRTLLFAGDGSVWLVACREAGLCRHPADDAPLRRTDTGADRFTALEGLSSDSTMTLLEDREGSIWVGSKLGLDRFRRNDVVVVRLPQAPVYFALVPDRDGAMWIGTAARSGVPDRWWYWERPGQSPVASPGFAGEVTATWRDADGSILLAGPTGFWRFAQGAFESLPVPDQEKGVRVQAIVRDGGGRLWMSFRASTVYRLDGDRWLARGGLADLPDLPPARAVVDESGRLWFGYTSNRLAIVDGDHVHLFSEADGLGTGTVTAILPGKIALVGGERGTALFDGKRFRSLKATQPDALTGVTGLLRTRDGTLWINGNAGAARIAADDLGRAFAEPDFVLPVELFGMDDGMPGAAQQVRPLPTAVAGTDGRLWFAASDGLAWIDPADLHRNAVPPTLVIRELVTGERSYAPVRNLSLPAHTRNLRIAYSALSLAVPDKLAFRYRLDGLDDDWQDPGSRREAIYTNLGPGHYRFRVIAANEDGVWNTHGASVDFIIAPTFFQTGWFVALCVAGALIMLWFAYRLHLHRATARVHQRLEERHGERERIARELHDTLLQGIQGLMLRFHVAASRLPEGEAREGLRQALDAADGVLVEGRDRVSELRAASDEVTDLAAAYAALAAEFGVGEAPVLTLVVEGDARQLDPLVADELYRIGREALFNAFVHAEASEIEVEISFDIDALRLRFRDNGRGIDPSILVSGRDGHWGLRGMRERADKIGASLDILSRQGRGTEVALSLSAQGAYVRGARGDWRRLLRRLSRMR